MIEDILDLTTEIINQVQNEYTRPQAFVLHTVIENETPYVQIEALNRNHTVLFKIRAKQSDVGLIFKYPCIYEYDDALLRKWKLKRMNMENLPDKTYWDLLKFGDVFNLEYDSFDYQDLKRLVLNHDTTEIGIINNNYTGVYDTTLLRTVMFDNCEDISLKILFNDAPLRLKFKLGFFDVYCLIAPRIYEEIRGDIGYLKV